MLWRLRPSDADIELNAYSRQRLRNLRECHRGFFWPPKNQESWSPHMERDSRVPPKPQGSAGVSESDSRWADQGDMCKQLEADGPRRKRPAETEIASWTENGGLFVGTNAERLAEYRRFAETGKYFGIESHVLSPAEVKEVHPLLRVDDIYGGVYSPGDGTIDPTSICNAYAKAARKFGGGIYENVAVSGIEDYMTLGGSNSRRVQAVLTACGKRIETRTVVNAGGAWANEVASMVGVEIPLKAMKHAMVLTEPIEGMHSGLPNVRDHDLSVYLKTQGDSMAIGGYEQNPEFWPDVDPQFAFGLFELDYDTFGQNLAGHMQRCPVIEETGIKSTVCGPESFTPDHKPLMGPFPGLRGFYLACGFNSMGLMLGGGVGREMTKWILTGSPEVDLFSFDCARFHPQSVRDARWVKDRTHESYAKTYAIVFPHDEALAGRGSRKSALYDELLSRGCVYQARHGFERPGWFETSLVPGSQEPKSYDYYGAYEEGAWRLGEQDHPDVPRHAEHKYLDLIEDELTFEWPSSHRTVAEECRAAREGVAFFDQSYFGKFYLRGPEADKAVQFLCGADMEGKPVGSVTYTPLCNSRGGVEADLTVTKLQESNGSSYYYFAAGGNTATKDLAWIRRVLEDGNFNARIDDESDSLTLMSVQGPYSRKLLQSLTSADMDNDAFPFSSARWVQIAGCQFLALRLTFVGELGFELHVPSESAVAVYQAVRAAGEALAQSECIPVRDAGYRAIDSLSAEKNLRHWHADLSNRDTPLESGIGFTVLSKLKRTGDNAPRFLGREALEQQRHQGLQRKLVCLVLESGDVPLHGAESLWRNGECVGYVRSTAYGHTIGRSIAYGYVDCPRSEAKITNKWLEAGEWQIGDKGTKHAAKLHLKAPFDPTNSRVKGSYEIPMPSLNLGSLD
ncbi:unnamed protein product [Durusdinium trenchii]|uniref:Sarcosine dehydrogenase n=1 Tax=Durusdinium trenchii TaxID=1381693 RepID=A0ABP0S775_9DINO